MRRKVGYILTLAAVVMAIIGVLIWFNLKDDGSLEKRTTLTINGETTKTLKAEIGGINPGDTKEYTINIIGKAAPDYYFTLVFRKNEEVETDRNTLGKYVNVTISTGSVTVRKNLEELFGGETIELGKKAQNITITYSMPLEIGNEAMGAEARFFIDVSAHGPNYTEHAEVSEWRD